LAGGRLDSWVAGGWGGGGSCGCTAALQQPRTGPLQAAAFLFSLYRIRLLPFCRALFLPGLRFCGFLFMISLAFSHS